MTFMRVDKYDFQCAQLFIASNNVLIINENERTQIIATTCRNIGVMLRHPNLHRSRRKTSYLRCMLVRYSSRLTKEKYRAFVLPAKA